MENKKKEIKIITYLTRQGLEPVKWNGLQNNRIKRMYERANRLSYTGKLRLVV